MGMFGGKKEDPKKKAGERREKPTTARRSRRIVQPGAAKSGGAPGGTRNRSPEPQVRRSPPAAKPQSKSPASGGDEVLQLDDFADSPSKPAAPASAAAANVPDLDFQGDLGDSGGGPSRSGDAALLELLLRDTPERPQLIDNDQAQQAQQLAQDEGLPIDVALVRNGSLTEDALVNALTKECWVPHLKVDKYEIRKKALSTISADEARRYGVLPVDKLGSILNLAMVNPLDEEAIGQLESKTGLEIKKVVASRSEIESGISKYFGGGDAAPAASVADKEASRIFSQDMPASTDSPTKQLQGSTAAVSEPAASEPAPGDDFMDIADIDDLLGDGDEVAPALIEPVALEPNEPEAEPASPEPAPAAASDDTFADDFGQDLLDTQEVEQIPAAKTESEPEEVLDLEFQPEPEPEPTAEPAKADSAESVFADFADLEPAPEPAPEPTPAPKAQPASPSPRAPGRSATKSFVAKKSSVSAPAHEVEDLVPVTEEEFQHSIAHGRVRVFEKWVGIQTRNRILNAVPVDEQLDPLLAGLKEAPYKVSA